MRYNNYILYFVKNAHTLWSGFVDKLNLAYNLKKEDINGLKQCFQPQKKEYGHGEIITRGSSDAEKIGIITSGTAYLCTINFDDQRRIVDYYVSGNMFGNMFFPATEENLYYVIAKTKCCVDIIDYKKIITCCSSNCAKHVALIDNLIMANSRKSLMHIDILGQRTLRGKLMCFFGYMKLQNGCSFELPMPLSDFADYIASDRSAMMREIKALNNEQIIKSDKRKIHLL